ncbi:MAG TPA: HAD-IA family hydrolase [Gammaproteobacteria bacterium]|nr:HAD-IA family hydrolase [Gammaproteobacteria bacterium]HPI94921.1 HAD-IA family hydrolase [Gammaproteobacteria bacterium]HPQ86514.1 HAD-IA family hydrolase [Gammaproteobacteria bacterium]
MKLKCIIFDVDGTMADTERNGHRVAFNLAFEEHGLDWHWDEELYGKLLKITGGKERIKYYQTDFLKQDVLSDTEIKELHLCKTKHYVELLQSGKIPLRRGVKKLIDEALDENIQVAISTTTTPVNVTALLHATLGKDSEKYFTDIAAGDIVPNKKPAPDIYRHALKNLNLKAEECIAIEDSEAGLESAVNAGIKTIITTNLYTQNQDFSKAELITNSLAEVNLKQLENILGESHV